MKILVKIVVFLLLLKSVQVNAQCSLFEIPLIKRINTASLIIEGEVVDKKAFRNSEKNMIYTLNKIEVFKIFKGSVSSSFIEIVTQGGVLEDEMLIASNLLSLNIGDIGVFILQPTKKFSFNNFSIESFEAVASMQGFIKYDLLTLTASDAFNNYQNIEQQLYKVLSKGKPSETLKSFNVSEAKEFNMQDKISSSAIPFISDFTPREVSAGTKELLTITGSGFGSSRGNGTVGFANADDGGASFVTPLPIQYIKWQDNEIIVEVPQDAGTGRIRVTQGVAITSQASLLVLFSRINVIHNDRAHLQYMISKSPSGGYVFQFNELLNLNQEANSAFRRAFNTWKCTTGINWLIGEVTSISNAERDNVNIVSFDIAGELPEGVLGITYSYYSSCQPVRWYLSEVDVVFSADVNWQFGPGFPGNSQIDMETIALHELGHAHQLGHVIDPLDLMHYSYSTGTYNRELNERNITAGELLMEQSTHSQICSFDPMQEIPNVICEIEELDQLSFDGLIIGPNPVQNTFKIAYTLAENSSVSIEIFNNLGQKVHVVVNQNQSIGIYEYSFDMNNLNISSGLYFIRLYLNDSKSTYKIVKI
ncbi:MAG: T9SS type A sorting domain-containing protein [Bacteroidota bacterium]|nr:T9SS type A sorting domain-containing protein [Bacteroidota bacterium]